jgi:chemotaxis protein CheD
MSGPVSPSDQRTGVPFLSASGLPRPHHIGRGEYATGRDDMRPIATILGSCVATCLYDPVAGVGGMNHFLLPDGPPGATSAASYGVNAMELLINAILKAGGARTRLVAKVFGGARVLAGGTDIGALNARFVKDFLSRDGLSCAAESLGGTLARKLVFFPVSGRAKMTFVQDEAAADDIRDLRVPPSAPLPAAAAPAHRSGGGRDDDSGIELFG